MKTWEEIRNAEDLNSLTHIEYCIWFTAVGANKYHSQQAADELTMMEAQKTSLVTVNDELHEQLARITAQLDAAISDLQDAVDYVYNVYGESNETLAAITTAHWRAVIADVKKNSL